MNNPESLQLSVIGCDQDDAYKFIIPPIDCSKVREVRIDVVGMGDAEIWASPTDEGDIFYRVGGSSIIHRICARRITIKSLSAVGDIHLVGRS